MDTEQSQLCLLEEEAPARTEPRDSWILNHSILVFSRIDKPHRSCVCAHITQSSVAPPNHQREANHSDDINTNQKTT